MKFSKYILAIVLIFLMLFTLSVPTCAEIQSLALPENIHEFKVLNALNIFKLYKESDYDGKKEITRAEAAAIVSHMLCLSDSVSMENENMPFSDVLPTDTFAYEIYAVNNLGIMVGFNGLFSPKAAITQEQFVKVIVEALGYADEAKSLGGYPKGYASGAYKHNILNSVKYDGKASLTQSIAVKIVYNAISADMARVVNFGGGYIESENKTVLNTYLGVEKRYGIVNGNEMSQLGSTEGMAQGVVLIGNDSFYEGKSKCGEYLGYNVEFYVKTAEDGDRATILYAEPYNNDVSELKSEDIIDYKNNQYTYYTSKNKTKTTVVPINADIIYNGASVGAGFKKYIPEIGSVKLIDNNRDNNADVVLISSYEVFEVSSNNTSEGILYSSDGKRLKYSDAYWSVTYSDGGKPSGEAVKTDDILLLSVSEDSKIISGKAVSDTVEGILTSEYRKNGKNYVEIDDIKYRISSYCQADFESKAKLGNSALFYIYDNTLLLLKKPSSALSDNVGYVIQAAPAKGLDGKVQLKMLMQTGEVKILNVSDKAKIICQGRADGKTDDFISYLTHEENTYNANGDLVAGVTVTTVKQPAVYRLDSEGEITMLKISPNQNIEDSVGLLSEDDGMQLTAGSSERYARWSLKSNTWLNGKVYVDPNGFVISIPKSENANDDDYIIIPVSKFKYSTDYIDAREKPLKFFRTDLDVNGSNIVVGIDISEGVAAIGAMLVESISKGINGQGEECSIIHGKDTSFNDVSICTEDPYVVAATQTSNGDFIRYKRNSDGNVYEITVIFDKETLTLNVPLGEEHSTEYLQAEYHYTGAEVYNRKNKIIGYYMNGSSGKITEPVSDSNLRYVDLTKVGNIVVFDGEKFTKGADGDIVTYKEDSSNPSVIFIYRRYGDANIMVIYK